MKFEFKDDISIERYKMKKIKFSFINNKEPEVSEIFEFDEATPQVIINDTFTD